MLIFLLFMMVPYINPRLLEQTLKFIIQVAKANIGLIILLLRRLRAMDLERLRVKGLSLQMIMNSQKNCTRTML